MVEIFFLVENSSVRDNPTYPTSTEMSPFISVNSKLLRLNAMWKEQLKSERDRVRRSLITGNYAEDNDALSFDAVKDAIVTVINSRAIHSEDLDHFGDIAPLVSITTKFPSQQTIADEFTLNHEQRVAFMIITSHLDGDARCHNGRSILERSDNR